MQQNKFFPEIQGNFGFGCMRLPMNGGQSETAIRELLPKVAAAFE